MEKLVLENPGLINKIFKRYNGLKSVNPFKGKTRQEKLEYLNSIQYNVSVKEKNNKFFLIIPELSIIAVGADLTKVYEDLNSQKQKYFTRLLASDSEEQIILPSSFENVKKTFNDLKIFIYKMLIILMVLTLTISFTGALLSNKIASVPERLSDSATRITKNIILGTKKSIVDAPEQTQQERLEKIHEFVVALRPMVQELETIFTIDSNSVQP